MHTKILAHRGASAYAPENTLPAFQLACEMGADGFELDVHLTKDQQVVVIHDETIDRTSNGTGNVEEMTYEKLLDLDFSNNKEGYKEVKIPLLEEVFELASKNNMFVNVEIKEDRYKESYPIIEKVLEIEKKYHMTGKVAYSSFNHYILKELKKISTNIPTGILYDCGMVDIWEYSKKLKAQAIHPYYRCLQNRKIVEECKKRNIIIRPWTIDREEDIRYFLELEVDAIISNRPDIVKRIKNNF